MRRLWLFTHRFCFVTLGPVPDSNRAEKGSVRRADGKMIQINYSCVVRTTGSISRIQQILFFFAGTFAVNNYVQKLYAESFDTAVLHCFLLNRKKIFV